MSVVIQGYVCDTVHYNYINKNCGFDEPLLLIFLLNILYIRLILNYL